MYFSYTSNQILVASESTKLKLIFLLHQTKLAHKTIFYLGGLMIDFFCLCDCVARKYRYNIQLCHTTHVAHSVWEMFSSILRELVSVLERELLNFIQFIHSNGYTKHQHTSYVFLSSQPVANLTSPRHDIHIAFLALFVLILNT